MVFAPPSSFSQCFLHPLLSIFLSLSFPPPSRTAPLENFILSPLHHLPTPTGILCCCCCCLPPAPSTQHPAPAHHPQHQQPCIMLLCSCTLSTHSPHPMLVVELPLTLSLRTSCCRHGHQPTTCLSLPCPNLASGLRESGLRHLSPTLQGSS